MRGDFSRLTFDASKQFSRVLMQQGRVQLDADWNEQASLLLDHVRALARSVIGPSGGVDQAFFVEPAEKPRVVKLGAGTYFVNGIMCSNDGSVVLTPPESWTTGASLEPRAGDYLVYLMVVDRHITFINDDDIREKALGAGVDTTSRTKVVAIVSAAPLTALTDEAINQALSDLNPDAGRPSMRASVESHARPHDICAIPPSAQFRGAGNQLYRVEIHQPPAGGKGATFKWSRENGSVAFPVTKAPDGKKISVERFGRDGHATLQKGDWVELEDDDLAGPHVSRDLARVETVDESSVTVDSIPDPNFGSKPDKHPLLRRWDHAPIPGGATYYHRGLIEIQHEKRPYPLENGIQVEFDAEGHKFRRGDYWMIPARTLTGGIDWPKGKYLPARRSESGVAPLATITIDASGNVSGTPKDRRSVIVPIAKPLA